MSKVALSWFHNFSTSGKVIEYLNYFCTENSCKSKKKIIVEFGALLESPK
jgi:hypothetical protein